MKNKKLDNQQQQEPKLKGTFAAVLLLGAFLVVSWISIFLLFLNRQ